MIPQIFVITSSTVLGVVAVVQDWNLIVLLQGKSLSMLNIDILT